MKKFKIHSSLTCPNQQLRSSSCKLRVEFPQENFLRKLSIYVGRKFPNTDPAHLFV